jgi:hypothetical protein
MRRDREVDFKPWLFTIARNRCLSMLRARRETPAELAEPSTAGLHDEVARREDLRQLVADVGRLPEEQRTALVLSEVGDLSHAEIAQVLDCEVASVKGLVFRARSALVERQLARDADCGAIREELADASGGGLRRARLRYHLEGCPACTAYLAEVRRQRKLLAVALPVVPTLTLHESVMASIGLGAAGAGAAAVGAGGAGATGLGATLVGGTAAKVAVVAVLVGGTGVVVDDAVRGGGGAPARERVPAGAPATPAERAVDAPSDAGTAPGPGAESQPRRRPESARGRGARGRSGDAPAARDGRARRPTAPPGRALGRGTAPPGRRLGQGAPPATPGPAPPAAPRARAPARSPQAPGARTRPARRHEPKPKPASPSPPTGGSPPPAGERGAPAAAGPPASGPPAKGPPSG